MFTSLEQLQEEVNSWLLEYNHRRPHSGRFCFGKTPMQTFEENKSISLDKKIDFNRTNWQNQQCSNNDIQKESNDSEYELMDINKE